MSSAPQPQSDISFQFIEEPARSHPDKFAIIGESGSVKYRELAQHTSRMANVLKSLGCSHNERILIALPDSLEFVVTFFAAAKVGCTAVPVSPFITTKDYYSYLQDSGAKYAVIHGSVLPRIQDIAERLHIKLIVAASPIASSQFMHWHECVSAASEKFTKPRIASEHAYFLLYTSGSTGNPKAVIHHYRNLLSSTKNVAVDAIKLQASDLVLSVSKLHFAYGLGNSMCFPLFCGATSLLFAERPSVTKIIELIKKYRPSVLFAIPSFIEALLRGAISEARVDLSSLRLVLSAGERLLPELAESFRKHFGLEVLDGFGSTEMLHHFMLVRPGESTMGSCGRSIPNCHIELRDEYGRSVCSGEVGNLWIRGQSAFAGYWAGPDKLPPHEENRWITTGDRFWVNDEGHYFYCGRVDNVVKVHGMRIDLGEIELALLRYPSIDEALVLKLGEGVKTVLVACVVSHEKRQFSLIDIKEFLAQTLPSHMIVDRLAILSSLPRTINGKIDRHSTALLKSIERRYST